VHIGYFDISGGSRYCLSHDGATHHARPPPRSTADFAIPARGWAGRRAQSERHLLSCTTWSRDKKVYGWAGASVKRRWQFSAAEVLDKCRPRCRPSGQRPLQTSRRTEQLQNLPHPLDSITALGEAQRILEAE